MASERYVGTLNPGNIFRDWLVHVAGDRIQNSDCLVDVFKMEPASHTICRCNFKDEGFSLVCKFFAEPTGNITQYDPYMAMLYEYENLKKVDNFINVTRPLAVNSDFNCVLVTEYICGTPLSWYFDHEEDLYGHLEAVACLLQKLHQNTRTYYEKKYEFAMFHKTLDYLKLPLPIREEYNRLLGIWWHGPLLDIDHGCITHHDPNPTNYLFTEDKIYAIDFELSYRNSNFIHDLGILCAEIKNQFSLKGSYSRAESYIEHFLRKYSRDGNEFHNITHTLPFYMSYGFLRISRLKWTDDHRNYLLKEAMDCLKAGE
ncbi:phosphotransferase [Methanohalophilus halophilus]|uniref:Aminoglycoside phosphotransferase family protein n=1 Tax=Methanohalophilus halophilus TaxID=2177 RepID=A0A1L3Q4B4_9EURY|nr:phosphotransferase [Methanohalophilus halophilus]APH39722.1 serine/threonine protein phosphatase [Methanohalophilus halophilus]RNI08940.1 aminoglycoside phosphotransferase family protein [Methanohalophilus halophilus]SDW37437.1 Phosphotransferase enzyme family protein [Methanohalophilus halophilus]